MKKTIIGIVVAIFILGGIIWIARPTLQNTTASLPVDSSGSLIAQEANFDFGTISMAAGKVMHLFKIKNTGSEPVVIGKIYTSCMCTIATLQMNNESFGPYGMPGHGFIPKINEQLGAGEEATIDVVFDPAAHGPAGVGRIERVVYLENNGGQPLELKISAMVTP